MSVKFASAAYASLIALLLVTTACGSAISNITSTSIGQITGMHTLYPVSTALAIEITPNKNAVADKYYSVDVSYLKMGRIRTAIGWTQLEITLAKPKNVYVPLSQSEASTLYMEPESKLMDVFGVTLEPTPMDIDTLKDFQKRGIITIYQ